MKKKLQLILIASTVIIRLAAQNAILESGIDKLNLIGSSSQSGAINIVGTGNFQNNKASFSSETTLEEIDVIFEVKVLAFDENNIFQFAIGKQSSLAGTMVEFTGNSTISSIQVDRLDNSKITSVQQFTLPFNITIGTQYTIRIGKRIRNLQLEITSGSNYYYNDSLYYPTPFFGLLWGTPFIASKYGEIQVKNFTLSTPFNTSPRLAVWGDSFIEGSSLTNYQDRYISLLQDSIGFQNTAIMGRGGENSTSLNSRFSKETQWFSNSKYALLAIGINDYNFTTWKNNILNDIDSLRKKNIIPIVATLTPRSDRLAFLTQVNDWIRNSYNGAYIDVSKAVSANEISWLSGYCLTDNVHPSVLGHQSIYDRIIIEAPYLFRNYNAFSINYIAETTFEPVGDSLQYSENSNFITTNIGNNTPIAIVPGTPVYFRDTTTNNNFITLYEILSIPNRPETPANVLTNNTTGFFNWIFNPKFISISDYEYSEDNGINWMTCFQKPIISIGSSVMQLRIKATSSNFKSLIQYLYDTNSAGSSDIVKNENIKIYPNPVKDILVIENISEETMLRIISSDGRLLKSILLSDAKNAINTDELTSGFYIFSLANKSFTKSFKILKNN